MTVAMAAALGRRLVSTLRRARCLSAPDSANFGSESTDSGSSSATSHSSSAKFGRFRPSVGFDQVVTGIAPVNRLRPKSRRILLSNLVDFGQPFPKSGQHRSNPFQNCPNPAEIEEISAKSVRIFPRSGRIQAEFGRNRPNAADFETDLAEVGPKEPDSAGRPLGVSPLFGDASGPRWLTTPLMPTRCACAGPSECAWSPNARATTAHTHSGVAATALVEGSSRSGERTRSAKPAARPALQRRRHGEGQAVLGADRLRTSEPLLHALDFWTSAFTAGVSSLGLGRTSVPPAQNLSIS